MAIEDNLMEDSYRIYVPIEDVEGDELMKSVEVDENGDYIVQGVMTSDAQDEEDDSITPEGMDCSYFLEKGWVKYEHGNRPEQFIGEPLEVRVGNFEHPTLKKAVNGIFVKARLFAQRKLTKSAIETLQDLQKSHTKRRMGWSIEGSVKERNKDGKIVKSVLRNVVLTMNPVNTTTWAELAKSFAKDHELTIDMPEVSKSMGLAETAPVNRQSLEGAKPKEDEQQKWIDEFRRLCREAVIEKSVDMGDRATAAYEVYDWATDAGFEDESAQGFTDYVLEWQPVLKSLAENYGGETMGEETKSALAAIFDTDLEELKKSIETDEDDVNEDDYEDEEEDLEKSAGAESEEDEDEDEEEIEKSVGDTDEEDEEDEDEEDDEDEEVEKSFGKSKLAKSLLESGQEAIEVSEFLGSLTDEISFELEGLAKSIQLGNKNQLKVVGAIESLGGMVKSLLDENAQLRNDFEGLQKSFGEALNRPVGRKGVVSQREVQTLTKSIETSQPKNLTRADVSDLLLKSFEKGEIQGSAISRYENGVPLQNLELPDHLKATLGLA